MGNIEVLPSNLCSSKEKWKSKKAVKLVENIHSIWSKEHPSNRKSGGKILVPEGSERPGKLFIATPRSDRGLPRHVACSICCVTKASPDREAWALCQPGSLYMFVVRNFWFKGLSYVGTTKEVMRLLDRQLGWARVTKGPKGRQWLR